VNRAALPLSLLLLACTSEPPALESNEPEPVHVDGGPGAPNLLVFSRTASVRHDAIPDAVNALVELARQRGYSLTATEDAATFSDAELGNFGAVVFLLTTGDVLGEEQQAALERFIRAGRGFVGVHSAADTEHGWPWYGELVGAYFEAHSFVVPASLAVETTALPATEGLSSPWQREDEWYAFAENPRAKVTVLLTVDEQTYDPGPGVMGADHPVAWQRSFDGGRSFYTALGHTSASYAEPAFLTHLAGGIEWALALR
jgi:cytochrome c